MTSLRKSNGPLRGVRVVEFAGVGPGPFCGMMLADMGAEVLRIERPAAGDGVVELAREFDPLLRGRSHLTLDLKSDAGREAAFDLIDRSDVVLEGHRPGVMERLGLGPDVCLERNPRLVYCRITGWGQDGPLAQAAGHDINYISLNGALSSIGAPGLGPVPPLNLLGDYGGGGMFAAFGIVCGLMEARATGRGQVVDAAMLDGSTLLMSQFFGFLAEGTWAEKRGSNILDGGAPWYRTYETADGRYLAVGAFEARFWENFLVGLGLEPARMADRAERANWEALTDTIAEIIKSRPVAHWCDVFAMLDACVTPVLSMREGMQQPHMRERGIVIDWNGVLQPAPAPRFSETPGALQATREFDFATSVLDAWERDPGPRRS